MPSRDGAGPQRSMPRFERLVHGRAGMCRGLPRRSSTHPPWLRVGRSRVSPFYCRGNRGVGVAAHSRDHTKAGAGARPG